MKNCWIGRTFTVKQMSSGKDAPRKISYHTGRAEDYCGRLASFFLHYLVLFSSMKNLHRVVFRNGYTFYDNWLFGNDHQPLIILFCRLEAHFTETMRNILSGTKPPGDECLCPNCNRKRSVFYIFHNIHILFPFKN